MADNIPQWPFIPAIEGNVPLPRPDPRSAQDKSLAFAKALMAAKAPPPPVPMPRPDPRDWAERVTAKARNEDYSQGAIHPDAYMKLHGIPPGSGVDKNTFAQPAIDDIIRDSSEGSQRPWGAPAKGWQQDVSNGLFGVPPQHLQQMAAAEKPPDQNLPKLPQSGFVPSLSPFYMNDKGLGAPPAPNQPPIFWQPG